MTIGPDGHFAYVTESTGIYVYSIDVTTGVLSAVTADTPAALTAPLAVQIDPSGQFAYTIAATGANATGVYGFSINANTGALALIPGSPFAASVSPGNPTVITITN